ncbi:hypothetical protein [Hwangdonia lutea]|uniref:DUF4179 domain-containing protein n=1 Tax=Hwangdonia lutea TaxID=3075823 RepID=A0AA97ELZ4_9FLAO|nr:hypothetical protein [Hwangdonia sp. SCSIO 19198]WOD43844.1 hypothetical protein RNZ46_00960 [Hwangdonia sp. SCSIO 19198]
MSKNTLDELFKRLENDFDVDAPSADHKQRFLNKLNEDGALQLVKVDKQWRRLLKPLIGVAASLALLFALFIGLNKNEVSNDLASVSPKMAETQSFFASTIAEELSKIEKESSPETKILIEDTMRRMKALETEYESLKNDLSESGDDNRVIYAMISNFQNRIALLQNALQQINTIKQFKNVNHETNITI